MTIEARKYDDFESALRALRELANFDTPMVFRGHANDEHRLLNSWQRYTIVPHMPGSVDIDEVLRKYLVGLTKIGDLSLVDQDRFTVLEHGRHHGLPTPCLDFSYSPYVALFFAFNGVRDPITTEKKETKYSIVYALDVQQLSICWSKSISTVPIPRQLSGAFDEKKFYEEHRAFISPATDFGRDAFPAGILKFVPFPGRHNERMLRQKGALLYDTLNYKHLLCDDLEDYIGKLDEPQYDGTKYPCLYKFSINQQCAKDVFRTLELAGATGIDLFGTPEGVASDVMNEYNYNAKFSYIRDVKFPEPKNP